jgi:hypothetical protein
LVVYAYRRGLSNRPARRTFIACSGTGDCVGQVQREAYRGLVAEGRVRAFGVVVSDPSGDQIAGMGQIAEQRFVKMA